METYYAVKVKITFLGDDGYEKRISEYALVPAISVSDAETKTVKHYSDTGYSDVTVISAGPSQVAKVVGLCGNDMDVLRDKLIEEMGN